LLPSLAPNSNLLLVDSPEYADLIVEIASDEQVYEIVEYQVFALAAPFFTIQDDISLTELQNNLSGKAKAEIPPFNGISTVADKTILQSLIDPKNPSQIRLKSGEVDRSETFGDEWTILPFEELSHELKVISIDGISPLDDDFEPASYVLALPVGLRFNESEKAVDGFTLEELVPSSNYQRDEMTSLIMSGVTAMARKTAFAMSEHGPLRSGTYIRDTFRNADITHISNEVSFYEDCPYPDPDYEGFLFCSDPAYMELLIDLGTDVVELTGNHNNDVRALYKVDTVPYSLDLYEKNHMQWYAGGTNLENSKKPVKIEHNGNKIAFVGCNSYGPVMAWAGEDSSGSAPCEDWDWIKQSIRDLKAEGYLPIVTLQFQEDDLYTATSLAIRDFRPLAEAGAVIVNGSQSHVGKALEFRDDAIIHYGLGNLFFDQVGYYITYDSFIQKHFFYQGRHISTELLTITVEETALPRFMTPEERTKFLSNIFIASEELRRH
jgi:poly-gamma-glutamate synthesis protein (capsule biosynthesis protein)